MSISKVSGKAATALEQAKSKAESRPPKGAFREAMKTAEGREQPKLDAQKPGFEKQEFEKQEIDKQVEAERQEVDPEIDDLAKADLDHNANSEVETKVDRLREEPESDLKTEQDREDPIEIPREEAPPDELLAAGLKTMDGAVAVGAQQEVQPSTGPEARHEVVQKLIETMVSGGQLGEDSKGRKVMMMDVNCPGRGTVRVRLWKKGEGIELRMRADNSELKSLLLLGRSDLQASAKEKGVNFSKIEVAE